MAESSFPALQPGSRAFPPEHCSLLLPGRDRRKRSTCGHRVLLVTVFFFFFLLGPCGVRVSALGAGSEVDISRVPWEAPS